MKILHYQSFEKVNTYILFIKHSVQLGDQFSLIHIENSI